jgi:hypothetical protein
MPAGLQPWEFDRLLYQFKGQYSHALPIERIPAAELALLNSNGGLLLWSSRACSCSSPRR